MRRIHQLPKPERPRERLSQLGVEALGDVELLAVLLGTGSKDTPLLDMAAQILRCIDAAPNAVTAEELVKIDGVGPVRAMTVLAALEFARRRYQPRGIQVLQPNDLLPSLRHYADRRQETLLCSALNGAHELIATHVIGIGSPNKINVQPRDVFAQALVDGASAVIIAHNHPCGKPQPSAGDLHSTQRLVEAGRLLGVHVLDHLIFTATDYFSFAEHRLLGSGDWPKLKAISNAC